MTVYYGCRRKNFNYTYDSAYIARLSEQGKIDAQRQADEARRHADEEYNRLLQQHTDKNTKPYLVEKAALLIYKKAEAEARPIHSDASCEPVELIERVTKEYLNKVLSTPGIQDEAREILIKSMMSNEDLRAITEAQAQEFLVAEQARITAQMQQKVAVVEAILAEVNTKVEQLTAALEIFKEIEMEHQCNIIVEAHANDEHIKALAIKDASTDPIESRKWARDRFFATPSFSTPSDMTVFSENPYVRELQMKVYMDEKMGHENTLGEAQALREAQARVEREREATAQRATRPRRSLA